MQIQPSTIRDKCNHITFTLRKKIAPNILLNGTHITQTKQVKYLGLHLDTQLTRKQHTKSIIDKETNALANKSKIQIKQLIN